MTRGAEGLQDRRIGRLSARAVPVDEAPRMAHYHADGQLIETESKSRRRKDPTPRSIDRPIVDPRATVSEIFSARG